MLNELLGLSNVLEDMSIPTKEWHRKYKQLPKVTKKAPCIRIWIGADGSIDGFDSISEETAATIRKYGNNQNSFPAFNIAPLYRITTKEQIDASERIAKNCSLLDAEMIKLLCTEDNWRSSIIQKVGNCIGKIALELLDHISQWAPSEKNSLTALIESFRVYSIND